DASRPGLLRAARGPSPREGVVGSGDSEQAGSVRAASPSDSHDDQDRRADGRVLRSLISWRAELSCIATAVRFAPDSPPEEDGFELAVPPRTERLWEGAAGPSPS